MPVLLMKNYYKRNLPHYQPKNAVLYMTVNLKGSIPKEKLIALQDLRDFEIKQLEELDLSEEELKEAIAKKRALYFGQIDDLLDNSTTSSHWLKDDRIAKIWFDALMYFDGSRYKVICSTIMSNHVHFIFYKLDRSLSEIMKTMKGYSAFQANKILVDEIPDRKKGDSFWQEESFDRSIRDRRELQQKIFYVLNNPVKIGLVKHWQDWKWNYIHPDFLKFIK